MSVSIAYRKIIRRGCNLSGLKRGPGDVRRIVILDVR